MAVFSNCVVSHGSTASTLTPPQADLSYSYWAAKNAHSTATPDPKLLTQEEVARQMSEIDRLKQTTGASAWNMVGFGG